jgi:hypothetical protein
MVAPPTSTPRRREPLFDVHPRTGVTFEVFFSDHMLETFGRCGGGWFWWPRRRGFRQTVRRLVRLLRATERTGTR